MLSKASRVLFFITTPNELQEIFENRSTKIKMYIIATFIIKHTQFKRFSNIFHKKATICQRILATKAIERQNFSESQ